MGQITARIAAELASHEGLVTQAYRDSVGVWTWSIGITSASGHKVWPRYVDNPQSFRRCMEVYEWVLRTKYLPAVLEVFQGHALAEHQLGAALSFHYNTGGIRRASWAKHWKTGNVAAARSTFMNWSKPSEIIPRRRKERDLFFDGTWSSDGTTTEYQVRKPSYSPDWGSAQKVEILSVLEEMLSEQNGD